MILIIFGWLADWLVLHGEHCLSSVLPAEDPLIANQTKPNQTKWRKGRRKKRSLSNFVWYKYIITIRGLHFHEDFVTEAAGLKQEFFFCLPNVLCCVQYAVNETMKRKRKNPINCRVLPMEKNERKMETKN